MKIYNYPSREEWKELTERPHLDVSQLNSTVTDVLKNIRENGDKAVKEYEEKFDHASLETLAVTAEEIENALKEVPAELLDSLRLAHKNIETFHKAQQFVGEKVETARYGTAVQYRTHVGYTSKDCWMQRNCSLLAANI